MEHRFLSRKHASLHKNLVILITVHHRLNNVKPILSNDNILQHIFKYFCRSIRLFGYKN